MLKKNNFSNYSITKKIRERLVLVNKIPNTFNMINMYLLFLGENVGDIELLRYLDG